MMNDIFDDIEITHFRHASLRLITDRSNKQRPDDFEAVALRNKLHKEDSSIWSTQFWRLKIRFWEDAWTIFLDSGLNFDEEVRDSRCAACNIQV
jgi:hypothetical protein